LYLLISRSCGINLKPLEAH